MRYVVGIILLSVMFLCGACDGKTSISMLQPSVMSEFCGDANVLQRRFDGSVEGKKWLGDNPDVLILGAQGHGSRNGYIYIITYCE